MSNILFWILILSASLMIIGTIINKIKYLYRAKKYGRLSSNVFLEKNYRRFEWILSKSNIIAKLNEEVAYKISLLNRNSFDRNKQLSLFIILAYGIVIIFLVFLFIYLFWPYWYVGILYAVFINIAIIMLASLFTDGVMNFYIKKLPETIKVLQSRFLSKGNISKAIHISIPDMPKGIKYEMIRIYDALKQNEIYKAKEIFLSIDRKYSNEHMSVLLDLIWLAHYNGGDETIKGQFESMLNDILEDIENQQDLRGAAMSYIIMSILFIGAIPLVKIYNASILSTDEMNYYSSREGMIFVVLYIALLFVLIGVLFYLRKKG